MAKSQKTLGNKREHLGSSKKPFRNVSSSGSADKWKQKFKLKSHKSESPLLDSESEPSLHDSRHRIRHRQVNSRHLRSSSRGITSSICTSSTCFDKGRHRGGCQRKHLRSRSSSSEGRNTSSSEGT